MTDMNADLGVNPLEDTSSEAAMAYAEERRGNIRTFVRTKPDYYIAIFDKIGASASFTATFNAMAGLFGPIWFGGRGLWSWAAARGRRCMSVLAASPHGHARP